MCLKNKFIVFVFFFTGLSSFAQTDTSLVEKFIKKSKISGQWFLAYNYNFIDNFNDFSLKRGYFTVKTELNPNISVRYTQDITLDKEGSDAGNVENRIKYLYVKFCTPKKSVIRNNSLEVGLVHRPWLDFEESINDYRVQGPMFSEKYNILTSSDFGITFTGYLGGELSEKLKDKVGAKYSGKYGSYSFGLYNGGGYHAIEHNQNKIFESRLSLRPSPRILPGVQITYVWSIGKANTEANNLDYNVHLFYLSSQGRFYNFSVQYFFGKGNFIGEYYDDFDNSLKHEGISFFSEIFIPKTDFSIFSRYDYFGLQESNYQKKQGFASGVSYHFLKSKIVLFYGTDFYTGYRQTIAELALDVVF